jgi:hypothetical protein
MSKRKTWWRYWCYAIGQKEGRSNQDADRIAIIRTLIMTQLLITNFFIIAGNVKHLWWTDDKPAHIHPTPGVSTYIITK